MRRICSIVLVLSWGLWFGGMVMLFLAVSSLFKTFANQHETAGLAASGIFRLFNICQLVVAAVTLVSALICQLAVRSRLATFLVSFLALATAVALVVSLRLTPMIEKFRIASQTQTPEFARLHGMSMMLNSIETGLLLMAGLLLPGIVGQITSRPSPNPQ